MAAKSTGMTFAKVVTKVKKPVFNGNRLKRNSVKLIDNDYDVNDIIQSVAGDIGPESIIGCVKSQGEWLITVNSEADCNLLQQTGIILGNKFCEITGVMQRLLTVSVFGVPSFIDDVDLSAKLMTYGCRLKSDWTHKCYEKYPRIENGTRYITLELPSNVGSLPYSMNINGKNLKLMHNGQFRVCNLCLADDHLMRQCPTYKCRICEQQGHTAARCPDVQCYRCGKKGHKSFHCEEPASGGPSVTRKSSDQAAIDRVNALPTVSSFMFGATAGGDGVFGAPAAGASGSSSRQDPAATEVVHTDGDDEGGTLKSGGPLNGDGESGPALALEGSPLENDGRSDDGESMAALSPEVTPSTLAAVSMETDLRGSTFSDRAPIALATGTPAPEIGREAGPNREAASVGHSTGEGVGTASDRIPAEPITCRQSPESYASKTKADESMDEGSPEKKGGSQPIARRSSHRFDWKKLLKVKGAATPQFVRLKRAVSSDDLTTLKHGRSGSVKNSLYRPPNLATARGFKARATTPDT